MSYTRIDCAYRTCPNDFTKYLQCTKKAIAHAKDVDQCTEAEFSRRCVSIT